MYKKYIKKFLDIILALVFIIPVIFIVIICGLLIKLEDGGPVFYLGKRLGKNGRTFKMFKLRSMKVSAPDVRNADGSTFSSSDDPRLTKVGRFLRITSFDELPQIINILIGDMSFIGPRPDLPEALNGYNDIERHKLDVRPGISGYSQAYFRNSIDTSAKFKNDVFYVGNVSYFLDIKICLKTIECIFFHKNIFIGKTGIKSKNTEMKL